MSDHDISSSCAKMNARREAFSKRIIQLAIDEFEVPGKGDLTTTYVIRALENVIHHLKYSADMRPAKDAIRYLSNDES